MMTIEEISRLSGILAKQAGITNEEVLSSIDSVKEKIPSLVTT